MFLNNHSYTNQQTQIKLARPNPRRIRHIQRPEPDFSFIPGPLLSHPLSKPAAKRPLIQLSQGQTLSQHHNLPANSNDRFQLGDPSGEEFQVSQEDDRHIEPFNIYDAFNDVAPNTQDSRNRRKKVNQVNTWLQKTLPSLIQPYMKWVHLSNNMHSSVRIPIKECTCGQADLALKVRVVYWEGMVSCSFDYVSEFCRSNRRNSSPQVYLSTSCYSTNRAWLIPMCPSCADTCCGYQDARFLPRSFSTDISQPYCAFKNSGAISRWPWIQAGDDRKSCRVLIKPMLSRLIGCAETKVWERPPLVHQPS